MRNKFCEAWQIPYFWFTARGFSTKSSTRLTSWMKPAMAYQRWLNPREWKKTWKDVTFEQRDGKASENQVSRSVDIQLLLVSSTTSLILTPTGGFVHITLSRLAERILPSFCSPAAAVYNAALLTCWHSVKWPRTETAEYIYLERERRIEMARGHQEGKLLLLR